MSPTIWFSDLLQEAHHLNVLKLCNGVIKKILQTFINHSNRTHGANVHACVCTQVHIPTSMGTVHLYILTMPLQIAYWTNLTFLISIFRPWCYCGGHGFIIHHDSNSQKFHLQSLNSFHTAIYQHLYCLCFPYCSTAMAAKRFVSEER